MQLFHLSFGKNIPTLYDQPQFYNILMYISYVCIKFNISNSSEANYVQIHLFSMRRISLTFIF